MNEIINAPNTVKIIVNGSNNKVIFGKNVSFIGTIVIGERENPCNGCKVLIGDNTTTSGTVLVQINENNTIFKIGKDCMISHGVEFWCSDTHTIIDQNNNIINYGRFIEISDHVWIGKNAIILKNTYIPRNSVIGINSVVHGEKFTEDGSVIVGNPGRCIKHNINWDRRRIVAFEKQESI